jgi:hypothetical protein
MTHSYNNLRSDPFDLAFAPTDICPRSVFVHSESRMLGLMCLSRDWEAFTGLRLFTARPFLLDSARGSSSYNLF